MLRPSYSRTSWTLPLAQYRSSRLDGHLRMAVATASSLAQRTRGRELVVLLRLQPRPHQRGRLLPSQGLLPLDAGRVPLLRVVLPVDVCVAAATTKKRVHVRKPENNDKETSENDKRLATIDQGLSAVPPTPRPRRPRDHQQHHGSHHDTACGRHVAASAETSRGTTRGAPQQGRRHARRAPRGTTAAAGAARRVRLASCGRRRADGAADGGSARQRRACPRDSQGRARGAAHGLDVVVVELDAGRGEGVEVRGADLARAVLGEVVPPEVVRHDHNNMPRALARPRGRAVSHSGHENHQKGPGKAHRGPDGRCRRAGARVDTGVDGLCSATAGESVRRVDHDRRQQVHNFNLTLDVEHLTTHVLSTTY